MRRRRVLTVCEKQHRSIRVWTLSALAVILLILLNACDAKADTITDGVAAMLIADSSVSMAPSVAMELAQNIMMAQATSSYAANEPDSLTLSFASVLRAIWLEGSQDGLTEIIDESQAPLPFIQSRIAIDDQAGIEIFVNGVPYVPETVIDFGNVPVTPVPEPSTVILLLAGLDLTLLGFWIRRPGSNG